MGGLTGRRWKSSKTLGRALALSLAWVVAMSDASTAATAPAHAGSHVRLIGISLAPEAASLMPGQTVQFSATGHYADGSAADLTTRAKWKSSDVSGVAFSRKSARGLATAVADGTATITAAVSRFTGSASVTVGGPQPTLDSIDVSPEDATIVEGATVQYTATGQYSDGTSRDIMATVSWSSSDAAVASIDGAGLANTLRFGTTTIAATLGGASDAATLTVVPGVEVDRDHTRGSLDRRWRHGAVPSGCPRTRRVDRPHRGRRRRASRLTWPAATFAAPILSASSAGRGAHASMACASRG